MKKANKVILGVAALLTAFSVCTLTACGGNETETGTISGNYQEATSEDMTTALNKIESDKMTGDPTAADYKFGLEISEEYNADIYLGANYGKSKTESKSNLKILATNNAVTGVGESTGNSDISVMIDNKTTTQKTEETVKYYLDSQNVYLDMTAKTNGEAIESESYTFNYKINYMDLISEIVGKIGDLPFALAEDAPAQAPTEAPSTPADDDILAMLSTLGVKTFVDNTDGVKLKFTATEETVWNILALSGEVEASAIVMLKQAVTFNTFKLDAYFAIDKAGLFSGASVVMDIDAKVDMNKFAPTAPKAGEELEVYTAKVSGYFKVSAYTGEAPVLPEGIATNTKYEDMTGTVKETIGSLIGGMLPPANS